MPWGVTLDVEGLFPLFGVRRQRPVGEAEPAELVGGVDDPAGGDGSEAREADTQDEGFAVSDWGPVRMKHQTGSPVRLPVDQSLDRTPVDVLSDPELDHLAVMAVTARQRSSCRPHLGVRHPFRSLLGQHPYQVIDCWPPDNEHPSTMPAPVAWRGAASASVQP